MALVRGTPLKLSAVTVKLRPRVALRLVGVVIITCGGILLPGCAGFAPQSNSISAPLRISNHLYEGDAPRRASMQLVAAGLDADLSGDSHRALGQYERAISVDPNNPYAYLALARYLAEVGHFARADSILQRAELLFESQGKSSSGVRVHLVGLRGQIGAGVSPPRVNATKDLSDAARQAPDIWSDGRLSPDELL